MLARNLFKSALSIAAVLALTACGGGGEATTGGLAPDLSNVGAITNTVLVGQGGTVPAGSSLSLQADAVVTKGAILAHKWTITQSGGIAVTASQVPKILDADCATAVKVVGAAPAPTALTGKEGRSLCTTDLVVPDDTPNSQWTVTNIAASAAASDSKRAVVTVSAVSSVVGLVLSAPSTLQAFMANQTATLTASAAAKSGVTLDAPVTFDWSQVAGPAVVIAGAGTANATFVPTLPGDYVFKVTATGSVGGRVDTKQTTVVGTVATPGIPNIALTVTGPTKPVNGTAGTPVSATIVVTTASDVTLNAPPTIAWTEVTGTKYPLAGADTATVTFVPRTSEDFVLSATVTASAGSVTTTKTVAVVVSTLGAAVTPAPGGTPGTGAGGASTAAPFIVVAGDSQVVKTPAAVLLSGKVTPTTVVGTYQWTQISGPTVVLANSQTLNASFAGTAVGTYVFELAVTSNTVTRRALTTVFVGS